MVGHVLARLAPPPPPPGTGARMAQELGCLPGQTAITLEVVFLQRGKKTHALSCQGKHLCPLACSGQMGNL